MQDFSQLSSKTVTEVLMLEMKMAPAAKTYLISGFPRSMRDVVEYSEKVNDMILICMRLILCNCSFYIKNYILILHITYFC